MPVCPECREHFMGDDLGSRGPFCSSECQHRYQDEDKRMAAEIDLIEDIDQWQRKAE